jgi:hypothetical protein|tara:strand:+ start:194 stop:391 length:198 start_codon:yes stop_codon:yes gene_type:complete
MAKLKIGWCEISVDIDGEKETWLGNIRKVGQEESVVEVPRWDEDTETETIETYDIPNNCMTQEKS